MALPETQTLVIFNGRHLEEFREVLKSDVWKKE